MQIGKNVILTYDYEVFLGELTGTIENCIIKPTNYILKVLKQNHAKAIFFVDATWLLFLNKNFPDDLKLISKQLLEIIDAGSTIELHLHPQWIDAYKNGNRIEFKSFKNYKLDSLSQLDIYSLFNNAIDLIESITSQKIFCFRAGGYCIEPFTKIKSAFEKYKIRYDFSVAPGMKSSTSNEYSFDFSIAPDLPLYLFQNDIKTPCPEGSFIEIPISTYKSNPFYRLTNKIYLKIKNDQIIGDGIRLKKNKGISYFLNRFLSFPVVPITTDRTSTWLFKYAVTNHFKKSNLLVVVSHPKTLSKQSLSNLIFIVQNFKSLNSWDLENILQIQEGIT